MKPTILLSPPDVGEEEEAAVVRAIRSGWVAPLGPEVDSFESEMCDFIGAEAGSAAALASGSAGLELALRLVGVGVGDTVVVPTKTFVASANAVLQVGAKPVFIDVDPNTWNLDMSLVMEYLEDCTRAGRLPSAVMWVDLYGTCTDFEELSKFCTAHGIPIVEDAAEAVGSGVNGRSAGLLGDIGVYSFNGNKIMTTSGGGMLIGQKQLVDRARWLASQAKEEGYGYVHEVQGFNYRLSNVCAAIGRAQLARLPRMIERRRQIRESYEQALKPLGFAFNPIPHLASANCWLTAVVLPSANLEPSDVISSLRIAGIEARRSWNPMHRQPLFSGADVVVGDRSEQIFARSVCLPSGSTMTDADIEHVVNAVLVATQQS